MELIPHMLVLFKKKNSAQRGVTLIEMIVIIGIFAVVSSVLLFNYSGFSTNVSVRNLSQDIALTIRKAQSYATSVRGAASDLSDASRQYSAYGVSFALGSGFIPTSNKFILFADLPGSTNANYFDSTSASNCGGSYPGPDEECIEAFSITTGDKIVKLCTKDGCYATGSIDITFKRPVSDAVICYRSSSTASCSIESFARIVVQSPKGLQRTITVWNTGQISTQ